VSEFGSLGEDALQGANELVVVSTTFEFREASS
jgi:hypothetical protein